MILLSFWFLLACCRLSVSGDNQKSGRGTSGISDQRNPREERTHSSPAAFLIVPTDRESLEQASFYPSISAFKNKQGNRFVSKNNNNKKRTLQSFGIRENIIFHSYGYHIPFEESCVTGLFWNRTKKYGDIVEKKNSQKKIANLNTFLLFMPI